MLVELPAKSVRNPPGSMMVTLMPKGPTSFSSTSEKPSTPLFAATYAPLPTGSKEAVMLDALLARVKPALAPPLEGSPLERLHQSVVLGATWLQSMDSPIAIRLISDVQEDPEFRRLFLERFYLPRRAMNLDLVHQAISTGELPPDTDAELLIDALTGPLYFRRITGHAPLSEAVASKLASRVLYAFRQPIGRSATTP